MKHLQVYRETPRDIDYRGRVEVSNCRWCRWSDNIEPIQCSEPRQPRAFCQDVNPVGECPFYQPSGWTRILRCFRIRLPVWRDP